MKSATLILAALALPVSLPALAQEDGGNQKMVSEARQASLQLLQQIGGELKREYELSGSLRSVVVCKYVAPEVSSTLSRRLGVQLKRVSLRVRNPALGSPDPWEQRVLHDFDRRLAKGEKPEQIEHFEIVKEPQGSYARYMKAIPMGELCLNCHGPKEGITPTVQAQIHNEYPFDEATGFTVGQIRGAVTYKKPL